ncbi:hypothetical protein BK816_05685 [Boudabousia tangfeifanii]|uniref:UDP-N-acetylmuramoyl-tripeptide--D-alanyl-D-alanine ligase n=1 Tax=Boudabousia tangfeifanii TaxID=1912795 RepID=A0A1D9MKY9_9ACTO|nr:UDP-N-acetylmuramoyl-tripeptide--D-alanyl-D-alanine ligase [Boudabousia tangfeifanii]AOZ72849.1 hypothetical protein BK816_05685 [Boudabousia tangfeifanii]
MNVDLATLADFLGGQLTGENCFLAANVVTDSREVIPGSLYVAREGEKADGHDYLTAAKENGAVAALVSKPGNWPLPTILVADTTRALGQVAKFHLAQCRSLNPELQVCGVTGSAGKTTTKDLLAQSLAAVAPTVSNLRSFNNEVGMPLTALKTEAKTAFTVLEMGADGPGNLAYLTSLVPLDVAVVLMVGRAHLGGFGTYEMVAKTKAELVSGLRPTGIAVLNADDPQVVKMAAMAPDRVIWFSPSGQEMISAPSVRGTQVDFINPDNNPDLSYEPTSVDLWATDISLDAIGHPTFTLHWADQSAQVKLQIVGQHHVANALAAAGAAFAMGLTLAQVVYGLEQAGAISPHRMHIFSVNGVQVLDDAYNANPDSMRAGISALAHLGPLEANGRLVAVLGQMLELGPTSDELHAELATVLEESGVAQTVIVGERAKPLHEALTGKIPSKYCDDLATAREALAQTLRAGDTVLVKGSQYSNVYQLAEELAKGELIK